MNYQETIEYLYQLLPVFHREGKKAYKADLKNTLAICEHLGNPQHQFKSIHVGGTNGKGSSSHFLASILQEAGYKTGLYTSPHLKSFTERIKINGQPIPEQEVVDYVERNKAFILDLRPSFFECTVGLAFEYFASQNVDIAIIEVGLGGRLDSTNVITPELSLITNISFDHTDILGNTIEQISTEKAGIIKPEIPVVISQRQPEADVVFQNKAVETSSVISFASDRYMLNEYSVDENFAKVEYSDTQNKEIINLESQLIGRYQIDNLRGILNAVEILNKRGFAIDKMDLERGVAKVVTNTGLKGRWQTLRETPKVICDTGHNIAGITENLMTLDKYKYHQLWMILGFVSDKDIRAILEVLPKTAKFVFCQADVPRALEADDLQQLAKDYQLEGTVIKDVNEAIDWVVQQASEDDFVYVGGSTFVVAGIHQL
ncbi:folylpolyglutamate synthase/dihydrofolate synthase family protein [Cellulophaga sp. BC115SP]|uniref:bifunctional folylpolyglutamate synthase/dihydrofolate synthase n=1 Tax=Cellulophaga sp. BC115SP TaxID=2683263 RepID=UPI001412C015|nr:folylpolyglutamate synthase/dihydrofolate synthase family protein [Cellulophaga sp. BC115SP]NBB27899.1 bifunctional folylpolyglutamate synthase/dihydrofolate synthase [Cellulophaga sp. BC115SP]